MTTPRVGLIDYGMGNLHSVRKALEKVGASVEIIRENTGSNSSFDRLVLPGVGSLGDCMHCLLRNGLDELVKDWIANDRPFLGICLGMQALFDRSEENNAAGLGIFSGVVMQFRLDHSFKVPHIGWNQVEFHGTPDPLSKGLSRADDQFYFDHSFCVVPEDPSLIWGTTHHGTTFVSAIRKGNCFATQFHPEKSQAKGLTLFRNFVQQL